jgi:hypothetical protein
VLEAQAAERSLPIRALICRQQSASATTPEQIIDTQGLLRSQAQAQPGDCIVLRPDAYLALRLKPADFADLRARLSALLCN